MLQTDSIPDGQVFTKTANLKGEVVAVKKIQLQRLEITRKILLELKQARNTHLDFSVFIVIGSLLIYILRV